jgi:hypothetical protein
MPESKHRPGTHTFSVLKDGAAAGDAVLGPPLPPAIILPPSI